MVKPIVKDIYTLVQPCEPATPMDVNGAAKDLLDTFLDNGKVTGMAANMIGYTKRIIVINNEDRLLQRLLGSHRPASDRPLQQPGHLIWSFSFPVLATAAMRPA